MQNNIYTFLTCSVISGCSVKGTNNKALAKTFFGVYTKFNIVCTTCQKKKKITIYLYVKLDV